MSISKIIVSISGVSLLLLIGSGIKKPELFENQGYSNLTSMLVGGLLGVITSNNDDPNKEDSVFK
jgi:hypothetical protein